MTIEFYCEHCYQKVETPDSTGGKKGRCPFCTKVVQIPAKTQSSSQPASPGPQASQSPQAPMAGGGYGAPIAAASPQGLSPHKVPGAKVVGGPGSQDKEDWRKSHEQSQWGDHHRESKIKRMEEARDDAKRALAAPAVGLIVASVFGMIFNALYVLMLALAMANVVVTNYVNPTLLVFHLLMIVANVTIHTMLIIGANHMRLVRSYTTALAGAILALIPLPLNLVCPVSAPFAVWALVVLAKRDVRNTFRRA